MYSVGFRIVVKHVYVFSPHGGPNYSKSKPLAIEADNPIYPMKRYKYRSYMLPNTLKVLPFANRKKLSFRDREA